MICRLCLCDLEHTGSICMFSTSTASLALPKVIAKYFQLEVTVNDNISTKLCTACWRHLSDFEQFCSMVVGKQQMLMKTEPETYPEDAPHPAVVVWNDVSPLETKLAFDDDAADIKDHILCEPEIDDIRGGDDSSDDGHIFDEAGEFGHATPSTTTTTTTKQAKGRTRQVKPPRKAVAMKCAKPAESPAIAGESLRESRARTRELRRNASAAPDTNSTEMPEAESEPQPNAKTELMPPSPSPPPVKTSQVKPNVAVKRGRGRPKGTKTAKTMTKAKTKPKTKLKSKVAKVASAALKVSKPKRVKKDANESDARRSSIREMDEYIAANVKLDCSLCAAPLQDFIDLKRHFRNEHNCTGYMECCNNRYKKRTLYVDHLHCHKDPTYFSCKPCRKNFLNRNSHTMHMLRFHTDQQEMVHQCGICEARFAKKFLLTMHIKGHKGTERPEVCDHCSKTFRTKFELTAHVKRMHAADFTPVMCDVCGVNFRSKANFLIHKKALHPEGPVAEVQCTLCNRWLRDERSLRKHLARHYDREGNNKYRCVLCGAEKSSRVALSSHIRYHHSGKRHSCTLCGKEFKLPRSLAEHMATHTGVDLYSCQFCGRTFKSHANMHNHKKKMHPNEWVRKYSQPTGTGSRAQAPSASASASAVAAATINEGDPGGTVVVVVPADDVIVVQSELLEDGTQQTELSTDAAESYRPYMNNGSVCPI